MASGSGRYQSKVFSFLSQQSLRWRDKASQTVRQVQVAALWGLQILLYPVYTTFQTTRLVSRQIGRSVRQIIPQLQAATTALTQTVPQDISADAPLQHTLTAIQALLPNADLSLAQQTIASRVEPSAETALTQAAPLAIQGIASQCDTHDLVLVTATNQVLNILTLEQQAYLQRQIVGEVANYWRQQRLRGIRSSHILLPPVGDRPKAWQPIRVFYRLMAWMQTSPVALATDLFQESQVYLQAVDRGVMAALPSSDQATSALPSATPTWNSLDDLFGDFLPAPPSDASSDPKILSRLQASLVEIAQRSAQFASQLLQKSGIILDAPTMSQPGLSREDLRYFTAQTDQQTPLLDQQQTFQSAPVIDQMRQKFFDRLNTHLQLQESVPVRSTSMPTASQPTWETFDPTQSRTLTAMKTASNRNITPARLRPISSTSTSSAISSALYSSEAYPTCPIVPQPVATSIQTTATESEASSLAAPTYIEAEVKLVKYVKHPLEQVLEWLDLGMLWIEKRLAEMVKWLSDRLK